MPQPVLNARAAQFARIEARIRAKLLKRARIVTTTYRYKPSPKRKGRKLAEITGPAAVVGKGGRRPVARKAAAEAMSASAPPGGAGDTEPSTPPGKAPAPANDDRKPAIVTVRDRKQVQRQRG